ncbi:hypothetical protein FBU30_004234 [Linnemannia zychae]|nr:hypothetical protein FBU30_004234 [Linnemannia zychae]
MRILAFLNPAGRKTQSSNSTHQDEGQHAISSQEEHLFHTQANVDRRRPMYDTLGDADAVDQYKHIFQNRPINNQNSSRSLLSHNDNGNISHYDCHAAATTHHTNHAQRQNHQTQPQQGQQVHQNSKSPLRQSEKSTATYSEREQRIAMEQLRIVRKNLRNCSPSSSYFRRYAAMVDDWRNFLPIRNIAQQQQSLKQTRQHGRYQNDRHNTSSYSHDNNTSNTNEASGSLEEMYSAKGVYGGSDENGESEYDHVVKNNKPQTNIYTRTTPSTSSSMPSIVKELLREEELAMLASSTHFNSHHNLASMQPATDDHVNSTWTNDDMMSLFRNSSLSSTNSSIVSSDDTDANDADADENYGPYGRAAGTTTRRSRVAKLNCPRVRHVRQRPSKSNGAPGTQDVSKSSHQRQNRRNYQVDEIKKIGPADKSPADRRRSPKRLTNQCNNHQQYNQSLQQQPAAHFGRIHLEDIVRGIESEFTLALEHDKNNEESEDSLTYLVSGYENSGVDEDENEDLVASVRRLHHATNIYHKNSISSSISVASSIAESASPQSTLLNSSDAQSEASLETPSPPSVLAAESGSILHLEQPPRYMYHNESSSIAMSGVSSSSFPAPIEATAVITRSKAHETATEENAKANGRPSLKLQTHGCAGIAPGALSAFENRPLGSQFSLTKCNSTSSLYIDSTMTKSDVDETLRAVATVLYDKVLLSHKQNDCRTERIVNSSSYQPSDRVLMTQADIFDFMRFIFDCGQNLGAENAIITLIYLERMTELGNLSFHAINWRRLLLGALILSIKVWEDLAVFNSDVCAIFEGLSVKDVNALERFSMAKLQYNVSVKRSIYAAYYFRLRDVSEQQYNLHYGMLTLSMSQRDFQEHHGQGSNSQVMASLGNDNNATTPHGGRGSNRTGSNCGLMGMISNINGSISSNRSSGNTSLATMTHHSMVPVGPGYRKWTLKPLSVREADRLEARSALYCSNMMMEEQERRDAGCCLDEYSSASPEELHNLSATLLATASMHTISSTASAPVATGGRSQQNISTSSSVATMASSSVTDLASTKQQDMDVATSPNEGTAEPTRRVLRLKKSRSDFFFQNTTPASIM